MPIYFKTWDTWGHSLVIKLELPMQLTPKPTSGQGPKPLRVHMLTICFHKMQFNVIHLHFPRGFHTSFCEHLLFSLHKLNKRTLINRDDYWMIFKSSFRPLITGKYPNIPFLAQWDKTLQ